MAKSKKKQPVKTEPECVLSFSVNGHTLSGKRRGEVWTFTCDDWPEIAQKWNGDTISTNAIEDFMKRALAGAITVRKLASGT